MGVDAASTLAILFDERRGPGQGIRTRTSGKAGVRIGPNRTTDLTDRYNSYLRSSLFALFYTYPTKVCMNALLRFEYLYLKITSGPGELYFLGICGPKL